MNIESLMASCAIGGLISIVASEYKNTDYFDFLQERMTNAISSLSINFIGDREIFFVFLSAFWSGVFYYIQKASKSRKEKQVLWFWIVVFCVVQLSSFVISEDFFVRLNYSVTAIFFFWVACQLVFNIGRGED